MRIDGPVPHGGADEKGDGVERESGVRAVIFDMDGVLVDSECAYRSCVSEYFEKLGYPLTDDELDVMAGASVAKSYDLLSGWWERATGEWRFGGDIDREICEQAGQVDYAAIMFEGVPETIAGLSERGYRLAIASSSPRDVIDHVLEACGISGYFELVTSGADFEESKPNPAIYLHTLDALGLSAEECRVVEDSDYGITAAVQAGIIVIARREERFGFSQKGATYFIDAFSGLLDLL